MAEIKNPKQPRENHLPLDNPQWKTYNGTSHTDSTNHLPSNKKQRNVVRTSAYIFYPHWQRHSQPIVHQYSPEKKHNHGRSIHKNLQVNRINKIGPATGPQQNLQNEQNKRNLQEFERSDMEKRKQMGTFKGNVWIIRIWTFMTSHVTIQSI